MRLFHIRRIIFWSNVAILCLTIFLIPLTITQKIDAAGEDIVVYFNPKTVGVASAKEGFINIKKDYSKYGVLVLGADQELTAKQKKKTGKITSYSINKKYKTTAIPNDPAYSSQWALPKISAPGAWDITTGNSAVTVAVLDTGINQNHQDLTGRIVGGWDFVNNDSDPSLPTGGGESVSHGTAVASVIGATANNAVGMAGINWYAKIMPIRVMDNDGNGTTASITAGLRYATLNGAKVVNMSLGYNYIEGSDPALEAAINDSHNSGVTIVAAAGNSGSNADLTLRRTNYPAAYDSVIAVGATGSDDFIASYSSFGPEVDVSAPGTSIYAASTAWSGSAYTNNAYASASGTSLASPYVAGLAALLLARNNYTPDEVQSMIEQGADKVAGMASQSRTDFYGYGRINALKSVNYTGLDHINIYPSTTQTITSGETIQFTAQGQDVSNHDIPLTYTWTGTNSTGLFTNTSPGTYIVRATNGGINSATVTVSVNTVVAPYVPPPAVDSYTPPPVVLQNVYRFWNTNGTHFYTASESEKSNVMARWPNIYKYEGVAYTTNLNSQRALTPLYRLWNSNGTHFYTASYTEALDAVRKWPTKYKLEGVAYNVTMDSSGTPVYRFWNANGTHFYTASESEKNNIMARWPGTFRLEGVAYYLP
ncbi:MAG: S8 family serine peptidase [bacterium]